MHEIFDERDLEIRKNKRLLYGIVLALLVLTVLFLKFYTQQKKENISIKIKLATLDKTRKATPWQNLISPSLVSPVEEKKLPPKSTTVTVDQAVNRPTQNLKIQDLTTQDLASTLGRQIGDVKKLELLELQNNIEIADEIISREPDSYSAYKAKLISLLVKEGKFGQDIEDGEIDRILETMASFELTNDKAINKEAALISDTSNKAAILSDKLSEFASGREAIEAEMALLEENSSELKDLDIRRQNLLLKEEEIENELQALNDKQSAGLTLDEYPDEDIVQIPFLRMMAKNDFDSVIDGAQSFIERFPNSTVGHYFLIKAYEAQGRREEALEVIQNSNLSAEVQSILQQKLQNDSGYNFKNYWENLHF